MKILTTGISREAENRHTKVQSTTSPNYSFVRMNPEDRNHINHLFKQEEFGKVCNLAAYLGFRPGTTTKHLYPDLMNPVRI